MKVRNIVLFGSVAQDRATALQYKLEGTDDKINAIVGKLDEWEGLKRTGALF